LKIKYPRKIRSEDVKCILRNSNHPANYKAGCRVYKELEKNMFPALRKNTINPPAPLASNMQFEPNQTVYSYAQAVKISANINANKTMLKYKTLYGHSKQTIVWNQRILKCFLDRMDTMLITLITLITFIIKIMARLLKIVA